MNHTALRTAILARCREELATRYAKKIYSISWFPDTWTPDDVTAVLKAVRRHDIISCPREKSGHGWLFAYHTEDARWYPVRVDGEFRLPVLNRYRRREGATRPATRIASQ